MWSSSIDAFETDPLKGIGSGGFQTWFSANGDLYTALRHSHSLPFQFVAELGLIGTILLLALAFVIFYTGWSRWQAERHGKRLSGLVASVEPPAATGPPTAIAAFAAVFVTGSVSLAVDWSGEFPAVTGPLVIAAAVIVGPALATGVATPQRRLSIKAVVATVATVFIAGGLIWISTMSFGGETHLVKSRNAVSNENLQLARDEAFDAIDAQPTLARAYIQLGLVEELMGNYGRALAAVREGISRSPDTGAFWFLQARIETRLGMLDEAERSVIKGGQLEPKNPINGKLNSFNSDKTDD